MHRLSALTQIEALRLKREPKDHSVVCLDQEDGEGNVEYKFRIKDPHPVRLQQLITQMKFRLSEGNGECFYYIGIEDNGYPKGLEPGDLEGSIATLHRMASSLDAYVTLLHYLPAAWGRRAALLRVATRTAQEACHTDLRIAVAGSVDAGKSTLVAVLTQGSDGRPLLDNGRGLARMAVFRHKHEMQSGRTSSICHQLLGYDHEGRVINYATPAAAALTPAEITGSAAKVLTFLDLGGHERYLKTALYGMTALLPDYVLLCVCAVAGLGRIGREHLAVAVALEVPVAVVITKVELVRPERLAAVVSDIRQLVALTLQHESGPGAAEAGQVDERRVEEASPVVASEAAALASAAVLAQLHADSLTSSTARGALRVHMPVFPISAVTGAGLSVLHAFLNALQPGSTVVKGVAAAVVAPLDPGPVADGLDAAAASEPLTSAGSGGCGGDGDGDGGGDCSTAGYTSSGCGGSPRAADAAAAAGDGPPCETDIPFQRVQQPKMQQQPQHLYGSVAAAAAAAAVTGGVAAAAAVQPQQPPPPPESQAVHVQVDGTFEVEGVGSVVSGTLLSGIVRLGQELMLGPTPAGGFTRVVVRQLQRSHVQVKQVRAGQTCTIAISPAGSHSPGGGVPGLGPGLQGRGAAAGVGIGNGASVFNGRGQFDATPIPLGTSPGAAPVIVPGVATAQPPAPVAAAAGGGFEDALAAAQAALELCLADGADEEDAAGGGAPGGDDLFAFDVSDGPGFSPPPNSSRRQTSTTLSSSPSPRPSYFTDSLGGSYGASLGGSYMADAMASATGGGNQLPPLSMPATASQLHSTTSFCVGAGVGGAGAAVGLSTSAPPVRTMSAGAVNPMRKGAVLLEPALQPKTSWTFEAVLILLGGHWPPRGLVSGRWPPACAEDLPESLRPEDAAIAGAAAVSECVSISEPVSERPGSSSGTLTSEPSGTVTPLVDGTAVEAAAAGEDGDGVANGDSTSSSAAEECGGGGDGASDGGGQVPPAPTQDEPSAPVAAPRPTSGEPVYAVAADGDEDAGGGGGGGGHSRHGSMASIGRASGRRRRQRGIGAGTYVTVVHCGSVRQPARVLVIQELLEEEAFTDDGPADAAASAAAAGGLGGARQMLRISASTRAAAALMHNAQQAARAAPVPAPAPAFAAAGTCPPAGGSPDDGGDGAESGERGVADAARPGVAPDREDLGCLVRVLLRWQHRPEWLREGAKLLVRDRSDGRVAGAGFVHRVLL